MIAARRAALAVAYSAVVAWVNAYVCRELFRVEFTGHVNSIQGLWIAMARLGGNWLRPSWWPFHDGGMPLEHAYMPLVPVATALYAAVMQTPPAQAFNALTALVYILAPLALFALAWGLTRSAGGAFIAALVFSLTSPARALIRDPYFDLKFFWTSRRLYTVVVWDDMPHQAAMCLLPLATLFLWRALDRRRPADNLLAGAAMALTVAASVFGAVALAMTAVCLLCVLPRERLWANAARIVAIGAAAYAVVSPCLPPSLIATIRRNQQMYPEDRWSVESLTALALVVTAFVLVRWAVFRLTDDAPLRFFALFACLASAIPLVDAYANRHFLPQAGRYQPEMEYGLALAGVFAARAMLRHTPRAVCGALALVVLALAAEQLVSHRKYAREITRPVDARQSVEARVAAWADANLPGRRVMVPGSMAQWLNVFSSAPQLSGGSYSTTPNPAQQAAMISVLTGKGPAETAASVLWLKAFGVHAVTAVGPQSPEFWKPYADPKKFEGVLPVLWQGEDMAIYAVPQRTASLAHVVPAKSLARAPQPGELARYVSALEDASLPEASMTWPGAGDARIRAVLRRGQAVSVQVNYHAGWIARANRRSVAVGHDGLGLIALRPECDGPCEIELTYAGSLEYWLCRMVSAAVLLAAAVYAWRHWRGGTPRNA